VEKRDVRWLDDEEMDSWRSFIDTSLAVTADLENDLMATHGITAGDYGVLVSLSEAERSRRRMCDLANHLHLSPSGLTRRLDGMVRAGLVAREPSDEDRRVMLAVLTPKGRSLLERAAPDHVASVRRHFLDHLSRTQMRNLGAALRAVERSRGTASRVEGTGSA
jgi:DNA-binding MarR family transcriptional regulator